MLSSKNNVLSKDGKDSDFELNATLPTQFTLYHNKPQHDIIGNSFPKKSEIKNKEDLLKTALYDHTAILFRDGYLKKDTKRKHLIPFCRNGDYFVKSDCLFADLDNTFSQNPEDFITLEDLIKIFKGYEFYLVSSRNNNKEKIIEEKDGKTGETIKIVEAPRFKAHLYFPLKEEITDKELFSSYLNKLVSFYTKKNYLILDQQVKDLGRFLFGNITNQENSIVYYNEGKSILELLNTIDITPKSHYTPRSERTPRGEKGEIIKIGERNATFFKNAIRLFESGKTKEEVEEKIFLENATNTELPLEGNELNAIIGSAYNTFLKKEGKYILFEELMDKENLIRTREGVYDTKKNMFIPLYLVKNNYGFYGESGKKYINKWLSNTAIDNANNPIYDLTFDPSLKPGKNIKERIFNTYKGLIERREGGDIEPILSFYKEVWCSNNEVIYEYFFNWLAHLFQKTAIKPEVAIGINGKTRSGKGTGVEFIGYLLGGIESKQFVKREDERVIIGQFNSELERCLLLNLNEVELGKNFTDKILKALITDPTTKREAKGKDAVDVRSYTRVIFTTNKEQITKMEDTDSRWLMLKCSDKYRNDTDYFENLYKTFYENAGAFLNYLLKRDISSFNPRKIPLTRWNLEQFEYSKSSVEIFLDETFLDPEKPAMDFIDETEGAFRPGDFYLLYSLYCDRNGYKPYSYRNFTPIVKAKEFISERITRKYSPLKRNEKIYFLDRESMLRCYATMGVFSQNIKVVKKEEEEDREEPKEEKNILTKSCVVA
jgi:phage/plasmid-associated DNA primase